MSILIDKQAQTITKETRPTTRNHFIQLAHDPTCLYLLFPFLTGSKSNCLIALVLSMCHLCIEPSEHKFCSQTVWNKTIIVWFLCLKKNRQAYMPSKMNSLSIALQIRCNGPFITSTLNQLSARVKQQQKPLQPSWLYFPYITPFIYNQMVWWAAH